jgi:hypothetical protein
MQPNRDQHMPRRYRAPIDLRTERPKGKVDARIRDQRQLLICAAPQSSFGKAGSGWLTIINHYAN